MKVVLLLTILLCLSSCSQQEKKVINIQKEVHHEYLLPNLPEKMMFCGQQIHLEDEDIRERLDREIMINAFYQSSTLQALKRANRFFPQLERLLKKQHIPEDFKYLAVIESNLTQATSPVGAKGFWQFMPYTAKEYQLLINDEVDERMNIEKSTLAACNYLKKAHDTLNDWLLTAAAYNRGVGGVRSDLKWQGTSHYFDTYTNNETGRYVYRILAMKLIMEHPEHYGFHPKKIELYKPFQTEHVVVSSSIDNLALWAKNRGFNYKIINKLNPWILGNRLTVKTNSFVLQLPRKTFNLKPYNSYN